LTQAVKSHLAVICAGAGSGKTRAVSDFLQEQNITALWIQLSERDNKWPCFWDNFTNAIKQSNKPLAEELIAFGFPDTKDRQNQIIDMIHKKAESRPDIAVLDDIHLIEDSAVLELLERMMMHKLLLNIPVIMICRDYPKIDINSLRIRGDIPDITEKELNFTEYELSRYIAEQKISIDRQSVYEIIQDTSGWAFSINLIVRSLRNSPCYSGYVRNSMKRNIFELMEKEVWRKLSESLKRFLLCLSMIDHMSIELVSLISEENETLLSELRRQNAYIRYDCYTGAYLIHHLFLDFLRTKHDTITDGEKYKTYKLAAGWCRENGFIADALTYYEKIGEYESIVSILLKLTMVMPFDIARCAIGIFERAPAGTVDRVKFFASMHLIVIVHLGRVKDFLELAELYERKFLALPQDNALRNSELCGIYLCKGMVQSVFFLDDNCDFNVYYNKMYEYMPEDFKELFFSIDFPHGPWVSMAYSSKKGSPQKFMEAMMCAEKSSARCTGGITAGADELVQGELHFYQGNIRAAEPFVIRAIESAEKGMAYDTLHRALFYMMRIAVFAGNREKLEKAVGGMEILLNQKKYLQRFTTLDISFGWYHYIFRRPEMFPQWLREAFSPYVTASSIENFGNQIKARYCYLTKNYQPLLMYIDQMKQRESILFGRVEMLALEACVHYQMNNKPAAFDALQNAYENGCPNDIIMPFIELGRDMRTLANSALNASCKIPSKWLENISCKASFYAKQQSLLIAGNKHTDGITALSPKESEILYHLHNGFSRMEVANKLEVSVQRVNSAVDKVYKKLNVNNIAGAVRIAIERKLI